MTSKMLESCSTEDQKNKLKFLNSCIEMLVKVIGKLQERSPSRYSVVWSSFCLSSLNITDDNQIRITQFKTWVENLFDSNLLTSKVVD